MENEAVKDNLENNSNNVCSIMSSLTFQDKSSTQNMQRSKFPDSVNDRGPMKVLTQNLRLRRPQQHCHQQRIQCTDQAKGGKKIDLPKCDGKPTTVTISKEEENKKPTNAESRDTADGTNDSRQPIPLCEVNPVEGLPNIKPSVENEYHDSAVWNTTDHDYVKTISEHGCMDAEEAAQQKTERLKEELAATKSRTLDLDSLKDEDFPLWTSLPNRGVFVALSDYLERRGLGKVDRWQHFLTHFYDQSPGDAERSMSTAEEFFLVLVKLKTGFTNRQLQHFFAIPPSTLEKIFAFYVFELQREFKMLFEMPKVADPDGIHKNYRAYPNLKAIIDSTEVRIEEKSEECVGNPTGEKKVKFLVSISPYMAVNFVSGSWDVQGSEEEMADASKTLLKDLTPGSMVGTEDVLAINEVLQARGVELLKPGCPYTGSMDSVVDLLEHNSIVQTSREHVKQIINRIKTFTILESREVYSIGGLINDIFTCCAYLYNFQEPVIK